LPAGPALQHDGADDLAALHGGQHIALAVGPERPQRGRVPGGGRQEPVRPVGGDPQIADAVELGRPGVAHHHDRPNPPGGPRIPHHPYRLGSLACDGRPVITGSGSRSGGAQ
jgi:hypothetical protein